MFKIPLRKESSLFILMLTAAIILPYIFPPAAIISVILFLFITYFFRNPERTVISDEVILLSPVYEMIMDFFESIEKDLIDEKAKNVQTRVNKGEDLRGGITVIGVIE